MNIVETMAEAYDIEIWGRLKGGADETGMRGMRAALKAAEDAGYVLVPKEPTGEMNSAGFKHACDHWVGQDVPKMYRAMLAAAPKP